MSAIPPDVNPNVPVAPPMRDKISLADLIDAAVQKTYHELYTMSELMHNKSSIERKIDLIGFLCRARQLFIRLLALVKWTGSTGTVDTCDEINECLEQRAQLLRLSSDFLAELAREKLIGARSPNFPIADSIDVLTLGTVNFLPKRLSEDTEVFKSVTDAERQSALIRLQQVLTARAATSEIPRQYSDVIIKNGLVTLRVDGEFEVKLGVTSDNNSAPWRVYKVQLFIKDLEEPEEKLLHPYQIQTLTHFVQSWILESEKPFVDLHKYLHYYCQTLRLQILVEQAHRLRNRVSKPKDFVILNYSPCKTFKIEYWKEFSSKPSQQTIKKSILQEKTRDIGFSIVCDDEGQFSIHHWPPLPIDDSVSIQQILQKANVTLEEIYNETVSARCRRRFEELKETILSNTTGRIEIDLKILTMKCELLPKSNDDELLYISINCYSGLFCVVSYIKDERCSRSEQIEKALNDDQTKLIESINSFKIWLIHQRIPPLIGHLTCRYYTRIPSLNPQHPLIHRFLHNSFYIEFVHHEGFYLLIHVVDTTKYLLQCFLLIVEKRSSIHEPAFIQEQLTNISTNDDRSKWILEPLLLCPLDTSNFLQFKDIFTTKSKTEDFDDDVPQVPTISVLSLKSLVKLIFHYDEILTLTFLKDDFQRKKTLCRSITTNSWTGIPQLDIFRTLTGDENFSSKKDLFLYVNEEFWPELSSCVVRLSYNSRDHKQTERQWTIELSFNNDNYFQNILVKTPFNDILICNHLSTKIYGKTVDYFHNELRVAFELTFLFDDYAASLTESPDLFAIAEVASFRFFTSTLRYGPNFAFAVTFVHNPKTSNESTKFELHFNTMNNKFLSNAHQLLNKKYLLFLQNRSLKQFVRLLHMTALPLALIGRLISFNRSILSIGATEPLQMTMSLTPYTETRWRLIFAQIFAIDVQICGPNLIQIRDASSSIHSNLNIPELVVIPGLKEFLSNYVDEQGLALEFYQITQPWRDEDFLSTKIATEETSPMPIDDSQTISNFTGDFLNTFDPSVPIFNPSTSFNTNFNRSTDQRPTNFRSYSSVDFSSNSNSTNNRTSTNYSAPSSIAKSSSNDVYEDLLPEPSYGNSTANYDSDSLMDLMPDRSDSVPSNGKTTNRSSSIVYFSQQTFFQMFFSSDRRILSKFETFLASSLFIRRFSRTSQLLSQNNSQSAIRLVANESETYRLDHLYLQLAFEYDFHRLTYRIRLVSLPDNPSLLQQNYFWTSDELQLMETFFTEQLFPSSNDDMSLELFQNLCLTFQNFARTLCFLQARLLKDFVKILEIEQTPDVQHVWRVRWVLRLIENVDLQPNFYQPDKSTFLFIFDFQSTTNSTQFFVPLTYDLTTSQTTLSDQTNRFVRPENEEKFELIKQILTRPRETTSKNPCSLFPTLNDLMMRLENSS